jgi:maltose O-acetyltransferase
MAGLWHLKRFTWTDATLLRQFTIGAGSKVQVPLRSEGRGTLRIGKNNLFGYRPAPMLGSGEVLLQPRDANAVVAIGDGNAFSNNVSMVANELITIGDGCQIGELVSIYDCDFHEINPATRNRSAGLTRPVLIGNNVWLGSRVIVLKGVTIGDNSVVAAASVVTKSIPANCIAAGNPAKVIRTI